MTPLPSSGQFIASVRDTSKALRTSAGIEIKPEAIQRFLLSPAFEDSFKRLNLSHGLAMPLQFPSVISELNLLSILSLLNFASAYRVPLHIATGRGAYDNIRSLVFSMYLSSSDGQGPGNLMCAQGMKAISREKIADLMQVSLHVEKPHATLPGVVIGELGGPALELVELITKVLNETGDTLVQQRYPDLGTFVAEALNEAKREGAKSGGQPSAEVVLERVVRAIPAFQDMYTINDTPVYIFKKALFLIHAIHLRFGSSTTNQLPIPDTSTLPIFSDNVIPSMLVHLGVIDLSSCTIGKLKYVFPEPETALDSLLASTPKVPDDTLPKIDTKKTPPEEGPALTHEEAYVLRAAAIDACELIVEGAKTIELDDKAKQEWLGKITLPELDGWLWAVAKDRKDYRSLQRFVERPTVFF